MWLSQTASCILACVAVYVIDIIDVTIIIATNYKDVLIYIPESSRPKSMEKKFAVDIFETSLLATRR